MSTITNKKDDKKEELVKLMSQYVDEDKCFDVTQFRQDHSSEYSLLPHYFGGVNKAIDELGWVKVIKRTGKNGETATFKDVLAYKMLEQLRDEYTLDEIAKQFGVTKSLVRQLHLSLKKVIDIEKEEA